jgi:hypothetical protein
VPYPAELMYAVVSDVEKYPEFLPWVLALRVLSRREGGLTAEMAVGYGALRERYTSDVRLDPTIHRIDVAQIKGPSRPWKIIGSSRHGGGVRSDLLHPVRVQKPLASQRGGGQVRESDAENGRRFRGKSKNNSGRESGMRILLMAALMIATALAAQRPRQPKTIVFIGNSFTFGARSAAHRYQSNSVTDLNRPDAKGKHRGRRTGFLQGFHETGGMELRVSLETWAARAWISIMPKSAHFWTSHGMWW